MIAAVRWRMAEPFHRIVAPEQEGIRLDVFLASQVEVGSRGLARALIEGGKVRVGTARVRPGMSLAPGQIVTFDSEVPPQPDVLAGDGSPIPSIPILYQDPWLVAIDKPAGIAAHPPEGRGFRGHTVASWARALFGDLPTHGGEDRPGIVHRLDKETSGVMLVARNDEAFHFLRAQFKARTVEKEYHCIAFGEPRFDSDWIERPIGIDPRHPERMAVLTEGGRESSTFYEVLERFRGFTAFRCMPKTGRTHQIRVHMMSVGHSLVGDRVYRSRRAQHDELPAEAPQPSRHCLHARRLSLLHPHTHESLQFEAPLPEDMQLLLRWLRQHRPPG